MLRITHVIVNAGIAPFIINPHYLAPDVLKQIVYVLRAELSGNQNDAAIAAACLLSLLT